MAGAAPTGGPSRSRYAFLDSELIQLEGMSAVLPPIFLGVAAFLVNMTLARLVALEREQIGLLKAVGYGRLAIAWHYVKLSLLIAGVGGAVIGWVVGAWATRGMAVLYAEFYKFPFLLFQDRPGRLCHLRHRGAACGRARLHPGGAGGGAAVAGGGDGAPCPDRSIAATLSIRLGLTRFLPQGINMALRSIMRRPVRALLDPLGMSLASGLVVSGLFVEDFARLHARCPVFPRPARAGDDSASSHR